MKPLIPAVLLCLLGSCGEAQRPAPTAAELAKYSRDSAQYVKDSTAYARRERVIDSLSRLTNTDSLYHLYRALETTSDIAIASAAVHCEHLRLADRYGLLPSERAIKRMTDSLDRIVGHDVNRRIDQRLASMSTEDIVRQGHVRCVKGEQLSGVDGIDLSGEPGAPARPKRPGG